MTITSVATIDTMVKARFNAADIPRITGSPEYDAINKLVEAIAQIATTFKTKRYGGKCGVPPLIFSEDEARRVTKDNALDCIRTVEPDLRNPRITLSTLPDDEKTIIAEHKVSWSEYELELAVDRYAVSAIVANVDKQYIVTKYMDYIRYAKKTAHTMIVELMTHPVVLNAEKREIRAFFIAPWSDSPNMTLKVGGELINPEIKKKPNLFFCNHLMYFTLK